MMAGIPERPEIQAVVVCKNIDCLQRGADETAQNLQNQLGDSIPVRRVDCFSLCTMGPNALLYPEGTMYCLNRTETPNPDSDISSIVAHIKGGQRVDRLVVEEVYGAAVSLAIDLIDSGLVDGIPPRQ